LRGRGEVHTKIFLSLEIVVIGASVRKGKVKTGWLIAL
jgi:general stress protein CsbA